MADDLKKQACDRVDRRLGLTEGSCWKLLQKGRLGSIIHSAVVQEVAALKAEQRIAQLEAEIALKNRLEREAAEKITRLMEENQRLRDLMESP